MRPKAYSYVRMSTEVQSKGDSLHRQLGLSKAYAAQHNLDLQELEPYLDIGVSAFRGLNRKSGALRQLIEDLETQKILPGSYILIESFDRLSRDQVTPALTLFLEIVSHDVSLVTTNDGMVYDKDRVNSEPFKLLFSIMEMTRSNSESTNKSLRIKSSWSTKRDHADTKKLTKMCPHWMVLSDDRTRFDLHSDRVKILQRIFDEYNSGLGAPLIAKRLNEEKIPCWGRTDGWRDSYLKKILSSRTVLGELDLYKRVNGVRTFVKTIADYYPPAINQGVFQTAQNVKAGKIGTGGRKGKQIANLFAHVACCGYCGGVVRLKDGGFKNGKYLVCDRARRGIGCSTKGFPYKLFEDSFLKLIREVDLSELFSDTQEKSHLRDMQAIIVNKEADLTTINITAERLVNAISEGTDMPSIMVRKLNELEARKNTLTEEIRVLKDEFSVASERILNAEEYKEQINSLTEKFESLRGDERLLMRAKVQQRVKNLIDRIELRPGGVSESYLHRARLEMGESDQATTDAIVNHMRSLQSTSTTRSYIVKFQSGRGMAVNFADKTKKEPEFVYDTADKKSELIFPSLNKT